MRVCHCHGITDRDLAAAVRSAAQGQAESSCALLAGTSCGGCLPLVEEITEAVLAECVGDISSAVPGRLRVLASAEQTGAQIRASLP